MAPGPNVKVEKDLVTLLEEVENISDAEGEDDSGGQRQFHYDKLRVPGVTISRYPRRTLFC